MIPRICSAECTALSPTIKASRHKVNYLRLQAKKADKNRQLRVVGPETAETTRPLKHKLPSPGLRLGPISPSLDPTFRRPALKQKKTIEMIDSSAEGTASFVNVVPFAWLLSSFLILSAAV